jgi:Sucrase/ferredoxin-like
MLSSSNIPIPDASSSAPSGATRILLLPSFTFIDNVAPSNFTSLVPFINTTPINSASISGSTIYKSPDSQFKVTSCPHDYVVLLCSHKTRDARCGQSAPLIRKELERSLRPLGLLRDLQDERPGGVGIYFVSHVGGHKFSANVLVYRRKGTPGTEAKSKADSLSIMEQDKPDENGANGEPETHETVENGAETDKVQVGEEAAQCIWLARVRPEDCENIVRYTILQGKVVKPGTQLRGGFDRCKELASW